MTYRVTWEIDIEADTPQEAAQKAREIQLNPATIANVFDVIDKHGEGVTVDLQELLEGEQPAQPGITAAPTRGLEIIRLAPFEIAAIAAAVGFGDSFTTDWIENEGADDPDAAEGARQVELAEQIVSRIEAAHGAVANTTAEPAPAASIDYTPPEPLPEHHFVVRFYQNTTTCDRHCVVVRANDGEEARARVKAWQLGQIELTEPEQRSEELEREGDVVGGEFDGLAEDDRHAPFECDEHGEPLATA